MKKYGEKIVSMRIPKYRINASVFVVVLYNGSNISSVLYYLYTHQDNFSKYWFDLTRTWMWEWERKCVLVVRATTNNKLCHQRNTCYCTQSLPGYTHLGWTEKRRGMSRDGVGLRLLGLGIPCHISEIRIRLTTKQTNGLSKIIPVQPFSPWDTWYENVCYRDLVRFVIIIFPLFA